MVLEICQWHGPLKKQLFPPNNAHNTLDLEPLTRVRLMLHQSQAPTNGRPADQHYTRSGNYRPINIFCAENLFLVASLLYLLK